MPAPHFSRPLIMLPVVFALGVWAGTFLPFGNSGKQGLGGPLSTDADGTENSGLAGHRQALGNQKSASASNRVDPRAAPKLAGLPPAEARRILNSIQDPTLRMTAIRQCLKEMPVDQWKGWMDGLFSEENRRGRKSDIAGIAERYTLLNQVLGSIAAVDPVGFMAVQNSQAERNSDGEHENRLLVMMKWAEQDPEAAKSFLTVQLSKGEAAPGLSDAAECMALVMIRNGQGGVLEWAAALPSEEREKATSAALAEMAVTDPRTAAAKLIELKDLPELNSGKDRLKSGRLAGAIAASWARTNPAEAVSWAAAQPGDMRKKGFEGAISAWAEQDFDAALGAVKNLSLDTQADGLAVLLGKSKPERVAELAQLVENQPENAARAEASARVMSAWTHQNPEQASAWMARQPAGDVRDSAISSFVRWADVRDPEAGLLWASSMSNADKRMEAIHHIIEQLGPKAPAAVQPWLDTNPPISEDERARIVAKFTQK